MSSTVLLPNQQLNVNDQLNLPNDRVKLVMQADGNLVLYTSDGHALWASNTWDTPANHAIMQGDGNFVVYDGNGKAYWSTGTWGNPGAYLVLQQTGNLVVYGSNNTVLWQSNTAQSWGYPNELTENQQLNVNDKLVSRNGRYSLIMQWDGNLVLYNASGNPLWASNTWGSPATHAVLQSDGNFVLYDNQSNPLWSTGTNGNSGVYLLLKDDGNLPLYSNQKTILWSSNTPQPSAESLMDVPNVVPVGPGSAMTSWVQSDDGPHVVYADANGNLHQIWYTISTGQWAAQPLSNLENVVPVGPTSAMTSWVQSDDGPHVVYADANGNLCQIWYTIRTRNWAAQGLMNVPNVVPAGPGSAMTSWVQPDDGPHVVYADANGNLHQIWYTIQGSANHAQGWAAQPLSNVANVVPAGPGSPMTSWVQDDGPHVVYADADGGLRQIWYTISTGVWAAQGLVNVPNVVPAGLGGPMTSMLVVGDGPHAIYSDASGNLNQIWYTILPAGQWSAGSLMDMPNVVPAGPGNAMTSWVQADGGAHVVYEDANGNLFQIWAARQLGKWAAESLMTVPNVVAARPGGAMTSWEEWDDDPLAFYPGPHVVYADANGNLQQIWSAAIEGVRFYE
jgi:hypothetical protein